MGMLEPLMFVGLKLVAVKVVKLPFVEVTDVSTKVEPLPFVNDKPLALKLVDVPLVSVVLPKLVRPLT
mgnify:CR=1 FL=1